VPGRLGSSDALQETSLRGFQGAIAAPPTRELAVPLSSRALFATTLFVCVLGLGQVRAQAEEESTVIANGHSVSIEYSLKLADGTVADSNVGGEALIYEHGSSQILPALEKELLGMKVGESRHVSLSAAEGYGEVDPSLFQTVSAAQVPEDARHVGAQLVAQSSTGQQRPVRVHEVKGDEIIMDLNHPLAGQTLDFDVKILAIE
jgi:FKBP-type peptidyl-prolyl cis-trans isomerase SlyD